MSEPFYKRYPKAARLGMVGLTLEERGAYNTILDLIYEDGGPVIDNDHVLAGYMACPVRLWRRIRDQLIAKGKIAITDDGCITNKRAAQVLAELEDWLQTQRQNGKTGGLESAKSRKKPKENSDGIQASLKPIEKEIIDSSPKDISSESESSPLGAQAREEVSIEDMARRIYDALPSLSRMKTGHDSLRIRRAIEARVALGENARDVAAAAYRFATDTAQQRQQGKFAAQIHKLIAVGFPPLWVQSARTLQIPETVSGMPLVWTPPAGPIGPPTHLPALSTILVDGHSFEVPAWETNMNSALAERRIRYQLGIIDDWRLDNHKPWLWQKSAWGPAPGERGCKIWPSVLEFRGVTTEKAA